MSITHLKPGRYLYVSFATFGRPTKRKADMVPYLSHVSDSLGGVPSVPVIHCQAYTQAPSLHIRCLAFYIYLRGQNSNQSSLVHEQHQMSHSVENLNLF